MWIPVKLINLHHRAISFRNLAKAKPIQEQMVCNKGIKYFFSSHDNIWKAIQASGIGDEIIYE